MEHNFVAKYAYKYNRAFAYKDKSKAHAPKRVSQEELNEYYDEIEERNSTDSNTFCSSVEGGTRTSES